MMLKDDAARLAGWRIEIVATDLSTEILKKAQEGLYSQIEVQRGLPLPLLMKHFSQAGEKWSIRERITRTVTYTRFSLLEIRRCTGRPSSGPSATCWTPYTS